MTNETPENPVNESSESSKSEEAQSGPVAPASGSAGASVSVEVVPGTQAELDSQTASQSEMPFAVVEGKPMTQMPLDLYIPPDALEVFLEAFEGPLDLLLYLIKRQNLDILDIKVAEITKQYMDYIELMEDMHFELAAEYLVMAAVLAAPPRGAGRCVKPAAHRMPWSRRLLTLANSRPGVSAHPSAVSRSRVWRLRA